MTKHLSFILILLLQPVLGYAADLGGKVIGITDGDTLKLLTADRQQVRVRLAEIDAPEPGQPYAKRSRQALSELVFGKRVSIKHTDTDRYGRMVGRVYVDDLDVNADMVRRGAAWVYRKYARDHSLYELEDDARVAGRGIWALPEAQRVPPWEWRRGERPGTVVARKAPKPSARDYTCGSKRYCREMTSCDEARYYLTQCGLTRIDGDGDGVPCEQICR